MRWKKLKKDTKLQDHFWYLLAIKGYGTPMKAKYHIEGYFSVLAGSGRPDMIYWDIQWKDVVLYYAEMPKLPWEKENKQ